jgi:hypothetical protein
MPNADCWQAGLLAKGDDFSAKQTCLEASMLPLNREKSFELIQKLFRPAKTIMIAAPFFGEGALAQLGLQNTKAKLTVICDLFSGGCNPHEIKKFVSPETDLRTTTAYTPRST